MKNAIKKSVGLIIFVLCTFFSYAQTSYNGDIEVNVIESTDDNFQAKIKISNMEDFPIVNGVLVYDIVSDDNVISEGTVADINIMPMKQYRFVLDVPLQLAAGDYEIHLYFTTPITPVVGIPHLFASPVTESFSVGSGSGADVVIDMESTYLKEPKYTGQIGATAAPEEAVSGNVRILTEASFSGVLRISSCMWDDSTCAELDTLYTKPLAISSDTDEAIEFVAPAKPGVYAIRIEVKDDQGTVAMYRNRLMVSGASGKIRAITLDSLDGGKVSVTVSGSVAPAEDLQATLVVSVDGAEQTRAVTIPARQLVTEEFTVDTSDSFQLCAKLTAGAELDSFCYDVDSDSFGKQLTITTDNSKAQVCYKGDQTDIKYIVVDSSGTIVAQATEQISPCMNKDLGLETGTYVIAVRDVSNMEDYEHKFSVTAMADSPDTPVPGDKPMDKPMDKPAKNSTLLWVAGIAVLILVVALIYRSLTKREVPK